LDPRFIFDDPRTASQRRRTELAILKQKIESRFFEKKVNLGQSVDRFIAELDMILNNFHQTTADRKHQRLEQNQQQKQQRQVISYDDLPTIIHSNLRQFVNRSMDLNNKKKKRMNYSRVVKRLKHKLRSANVVIQKSDKLKIFHLSKRQDYQTKSMEYMVKTAAYECLGENDPLPDLIERTNEQVPIEFKISPLY